MTEKKAAPLDYWTELAPGCYGGPEAPRLSWHRTWEAAVARANKSDRVVACAPDGRRHQIPRQNDPKLGNGRYGNSLRRGR